jgi:hypothetical protein
MSNDPKYSTLLDIYTDLAIKHEKLLAKIGFSKCQRCEKERKCDQHCPCGKKYCSKCFKQRSTTIIFKPCSCCKKSSCVHCDLFNCSCCDNVLCHDCQSNLYICNGCEWIMCCWEKYACGNCKLLWCRKCESESAHNCKPINATCGHIVYNTGGIKAKYELYKSIGYYGHSDMTYCKECLYLHRREQARAEIITLRLVNLRISNPLPLELLELIYAKNSF